MKRKNYEKPTAQVVQLQQQCQILAGSVGVTRDDYGDVIDDTWSARELMNDDDLNDFFK